MTTTMAEPREFKPLKQVGTIKVTDSSELRFYVDEFKGHAYASIRTFVERENYSGPTKAGLTMNLQLIGEVMGKLADLPDEPKITEDTEIARLPKKAGIELVIRVTIYQDTTGIDLREWVDDDNYKGWSKKGVRIEYKELANVRKYLGEMQAFLEEKKK